MDREVPPPLILKGENASKPYSRILRGDGSWFRIFHLWLNHGHGGDDECRGAAGYF